jgi:hypothetical protein
MLSISEIEEYDSLILLGLFSISESGRHPAAEGQHPAAKGRPDGEGEDDAYLPSVVVEDEAQPSPAIPPQRRDKDSWTAEFCKADRKESIRWVYSNYRMRGW